MFNKSTDQTTPPSGSGPTRPSNVKSVFASDLKITGEITSLGDIEMMGEVDGNISARTVIIGSEGRMTGTVTAETVEVRGKMAGQIAAGTFTLRAAAQVAADVDYGNLVIESGSQIEGHFSRIKS
ncbi:MAG: polymer-forming cytoskeletal protein [Rhodobacteraceae bacterium]|nr:polymer-forming cytoskeletal protein [Paracoccaceae bacterium]